MYQTSKLDDKIPPHWISYLQQIKQRPIAYVDLHTEYDPIKARDRRQDFGRKDRRMKRTNYEEK